MKKPSWTLFAFILGIIAIASVVIILMRASNELAGRNPPVSADSDIAPGEDFFQRLEAREADLLAHGNSSPEVTREGRTLRVAGVRGTLDFKDCLDCGPEKDVEHYLVDRFKDPAAVLIYRQFYESDDYVLVFAGGTKLELPSYPVFSPDKKRFVVVSAAEAFNWNGIEIWEMEANSRYVRRMKFEPKASETYRFLAWDGSDRVRLEVTRPSEANAGDNICQGIMLERQNNVWALRSLPDTVRNEACPTVEDWIPEALRRYGKDASLGN